MPITFEESQAAIARLVKHFLINRETYRAPAYKEAHARQEFIDPLFVALGWDVANAQQAAPDYREVVVEDTVEIAGQKKAPDYVFRVGRERKFFVEAKKPGVDLKHDAAPAYQLRRYAWTAKLPLSLLTDFEELAVYDCRARPSDKDKASVGRLHYFGCEDYADHWREIWDLFSREAVWGGAFDKFATASGGKRGAATVDAEFLKEIEGWRETLARNLALRNDALSVDEVNDAVQRTIDRLIFLRMAEDRGIEDYGRLQRHAEGDDIYRGLVRAFRHADARYNSGLFDFSKTGDTLTPNLTVDDKVLRPIIAGLYFPQSPYEFSVLPVEILGNIYEQFLGKVIRLTSGHQAKVEVKPEVKKAGGVYYTPAYIVEYIVKQTVGVAVAGKAPPQLKGFRCLDPACGSGSFLLGAYQYLLDYYLGWYVTNAPEKHPKAVWQNETRGLSPLSNPQTSPVHSWRLTTAERKRILLEHIFGVDIDRQAVEVTKLSLLLKVLETESDESLGKQLALLPAEAKERVLPNLDANIKCGNSLIGPDYFTGQLLPDSDELRRVNPFDWAREFPQVFGDSRPVRSLETSQVSGGFNCVIGNPPYVLGRETFDESFKEYLAVHYSAFGGKYDLYIYFTEKAITLLRQHGRLGYILPNTILANENATELRKVILERTRIEKIRLFSNKVFRAAQVESVIVVMQNQSDEGAHHIRVENGNSVLIAQSVFSKDPAFRFNVHADAYTDQVIERIQASAISLGSITDICIGIQLGGSSGHDTKESFLATKRKDATHKRVLDGRDINRYQKTWGSSYVRYGDWLHRKRDEKYFLNPKLLFRQIGKTPIVTFDDENFYTLNTIYNLISTSEYSLKYLLGIINSKLGGWFWLKKNYDFKTLFPKIKKSQIESAPIRPINFSDPADKARHDQMVALVEQMLDLHQRLAATAEAGEQARLQRLIDSTDGQIDALVYALYGLTAEEVAVVEGRGG